MVKIIVMTKYSVMFFDILLYFFSKHKTHKTNTKDSCQVQEQIESILNCGTFFKICIKVINPCPCLNRSLPQTITISPDTGS